MTNNKIFGNPFLLFLPFLILFIIYVLAFPTNGQRGDEARYLMFAHNILNGFYSPPAPYINLTNGPGYPLILVPFLGLGLPLIYLTILNAFFYYFSIIFLYKALQEIVNQQLTVIFSLFWACYYIAYQNIPFTHTETFTYLLISILIFSLIKSFKPEASKEIKLYTLLAGFITGYIVLTKIAFIYVFWVLFFCALIIYLFNRKKINYKRSVVILSIGLVIILPYLIYAYHITGRMFYWNTNTGATLYWSSTPYSDEYGDWKQDLQQGTIEWGNFNIPGSNDSLIAHHQKDYHSIFKSNDFTQFGMAQDDGFKKIAMDNIKEHPFKYLQNCFYNVGRLIFHYPFSYAVERPKVLLVFPLNGIVFTLILFCLIPTIKNWRSIIFPLRFLLLFTFLYLGLSSMVTAYVRMFTIIVPILLFWFAFIFQKTVKINFKFKKE